MMDDDTTPSAPQDGAARKPKMASGSTMEASTMNDTLTTTTNSNTGTSTAGTPATGKGTLDANESGMGTAGTSAHRAEAKSRFTAAVSEAKAGVAALKAEAGERAGSYREQAGQRGQALKSDAKTYAADAKVKGRDLATQGKGKVSEGLTALGQTISDNAYVVDEKLGAKYGDYARQASQSLQDAAVKLDAKSVDELGEDARAFVRKSPGTAIGIAAVAGYLLSRLFSGSRR